MNRLFTVISLLQLLLLLFLLLSPTFSTGSQFSVGPFGPIDASNAWYLKWIVVGLALNPAILIVSALKRAWYRFHGREVPSRHDEDAHPGFCESCGYDLRATPDRCPECGTPVTTRAADAK